MEAWSSSRRLESAGWRRRTAGFQVLPAAALFSSPSPLFPPARCCDGASPCGSIGVISARSSLPARCTRSLPFPSRARIAPCFPPARTRRRPFFPSARTRLSFGRSPWRPRRRLGDAFPREATPYAGTAWRAGRLNREVAWTPWRCLGDA